MLRVSLESDDANSPRATAHTDDECNQRWQRRDSNPSSPISCSKSPIAQAGLQCRSFRTICTRLSVRFAAALDGVFSLPRRRSEEAEDALISEI
jgi:hypothetical protein